MQQLKSVCGTSALLFGFAAVVLACSGCFFESSLDRATCSESEEGEYRNGRVCRQGYWVSVDGSSWRPTSDAGSTDGETGPSADGCLPSSEECNGEDDDCDGEVDEGGVCDCNFQGIEEGVCGEATRNADGECERPPRYSDIEFRCSDGLDNDCDGETDELDSDCQCSDDDESRPCYTGPDATEGVGICSGGEQTCRRGLWGACEGEKTPESGEICGDGEDNDCDGTVDEGCPCDYDDTSEGVCSRGTVGPMGNCSEPEEYEKNEASCDGVDNDCDGVTDPGCGCSFDDIDVGVCKHATRSENGTCEKPDDYEDDETRCDGKDNDCDGEIDEGCTCTPGANETCYSGPSGTEGTGICQSGTRTCRSDGEWGPCAREQAPESEACNGADDDCDGVIDEGCPCDYDETSEGVCSEGSTAPDGTCDPPGAWEQDESLCDGLDNDCDGTVDEGCPCDYDGKAAGVCATATIDTDTGACSEPAEYEQTESSCDGVDNDCDGTVDEGCSCDYQGESEGVCGSATIGPDGNCTEPDHYESSTDAESSCDGLDNDCDGVADEGCPCNFQSNPEGVCGTATRNNQGDCPEPAGFEPTDDEGGINLCDQLDNDCDGAIDEGCSCDYDGKPTGVCTEATRDSDGTCLEPSAYESPESTNCDDGLDNDCDGTVDEAEKGAAESCSKDCECVSGNCVDGNCSQRVFVTGDATTFDGDLGGLSGADTKCQNAANDAGLTGTWKAVLSDGSTSALDRITISAQVDDMEGEKVDDASDFWDGQHEGSIEHGPDGTRITTCFDCDDDHVWTGTSPDGSSQGTDCDDWTSNDGGRQGRVGDAEPTDSEWVDHEDEDCDDTYHLYCIDGQ